MILYDSIEKSYYQTLRNNITNNVSFAIVDPRKNLIKNKDIDYKKLLGELLYHLQGKDDLETISYYDSEYKKLSDDNTTVNAMLGARMFFYEGLFDIYQNEKTNSDGEKIQEFTCEHIILNQFEKCIEKLTVGEKIFNINIFNPLLDINTNNSSDISNLVFYITDNKLNLSVNFINQDFYKEYPYVSFILSTILCMLCSKLKIDCGLLVFNYVQLILPTVKIKEYYLYDTIPLLEPNEYYDDIIFVTRIFNLEMLSRVQGSLINIEECKKQIETINNKYWQSLTASIIKFNTGFNDFDNYIIQEHNNFFF